MSNERSDDTKAPKTMISAHNFKEGMLWTVVDGVTTASPVDDTPTKKIMIPIVDQHR